MEGWKQNSIALECICYFSVALLGKCTATLYGASDMNESLTDTTYCKNR